MQLSHPVLENYFYDTDTQSVYHRLGPMRVKLTLLADTQDRRYFPYASQNSAERMYVKNFAKECARVK